MEEKKGFKKVSLEELENISGGEILEIDGVYWAVSDVDGTPVFWANGSRDVGNAVDAARVRGWNTKTMTKEEFKEKYGMDFVPWGRIDGKAINVTE